LNSEFVKELVGEFVGEAKSFRPKLDKAFADDDLLTVQNLSIELKGAADNLRIHEISSALQQLIRCSNSAGGKKALDELYGLIDQL
jgi:HPt (histidine-containing phosphotransfer) domain-containing protein